MSFDALIIGAGVAGMSCALVLGSAKTKEFAKDKKVGIITHQKTSHLQKALFNNVLGLSPGTLGRDILESGKQQLTDLYPEIIQIEKEKVNTITEAKNGYNVDTNKNTYKTKIVVIAVGYTNLFTIKGLESYIAPHPKANAEKERILNILSFPNF
jgi:thioredoxin reductase